MIDELRSNFERPGKFGISLLMRPSPLLRHPFDIPMVGRDGHGAMVRVEECIQSVGGARVPTGLRIRTVPQGNSLKDAIEQAGYLAERVAHICSLASNQGTPVVQLETAYQAGKNPKRLAIFLVEFPMATLPRREIDLFSILDAFEGLEFSLDDKQSRRIQRALKWYRKAISTRDIHDQLLWLWFGFQSLDFVLTDHYHLPRGKDTGIKHQLEKLVEDGLNVYDESRILRNDIAHPREGEMPDLSKCQVLSAKLANALRASLVGLTQSEAEDGRFFPTLQPEYPMQVSLPGWIHDSKGALDFISEVPPRLEFRGFKADIEVGRSKPTKVWSDIDIRYSGPDGTKWEQIGVGLKNLQYGRVMISDQELDN